MHWSDMSQYCRVSVEVESAITNLALSSTFSTSYTSQLHKVQEVNFVRADLFSKLIPWQSQCRSKIEAGQIIPWIPRKTRSLKFVIKLHHLVTFYELWAALIKGVFLCEIDQGQCQGGVILCPRRRSDRLGNKPNCPIKTDCFLPMSKHCFHYPFW